MSARSIHTCQQSQDLDHLVINEFGIPGFELMARAGQGAFQVLRKRWPNCERIAILCGRGNNGGDGYILATVAMQAGIDVHVYRLGTPDTPDAKMAFAAFQRMNGVWQDISDVHDLSHYELIVDALFGSGLTRDIDGQLCGRMERIQSSGRPILALDLPSGLDGDTGAVRGIALKADVTVSFISTKLGLVSGAGKYYRGHLEVDALGIPLAAYQRIEETAALIDLDTLAVHKLKRPPDAHKGNAGRVLIIGGNDTMQGAVVMAGRAALRAGSGLVSVAPATGGAEWLCAGAPEIRSFPVRNTLEVTTLLQHSDVVGIGPGLGQDDWAIEMWNAVRQSAANKVVDADALNLLAGKHQKSTSWILTPHPGEAGRLLGVSAQQVQSDRIAAAKQIVDRYGGICVLKGAGTIVAGGARIWLCDQGNPGMATGGMGDVLTGIICSLWAQGLNAEEAACLGVWLHANAGDESADEDGAIGMMATDLLPKIRSGLARAMDGSQVGY